jgi:hypothetical protein
VRPVAMTDFEQPFQNANELWEALSPTRHLFPEPSKLIFRGQADASWFLVPSVLREDKDQEIPVSEILRGMATADMRVAHELNLITAFCEHCDQVGVRIPGDSIKFREGLRRQENGRYFFSPGDWPNRELFEVMAFAQHHGIPTRLLDWCRNPYVAVYFAVESALKRYKEWKTKRRLAIWVINIERIALHRETVEIVNPPGSVSPYLAAQSGLFTVQRVSGGRNQAVEMKSLEEEFKAAGAPDIRKLTAPVTESVRLYDLCGRIGVSAASLFPGADGAARAVRDDIRAACAKQWLIENGLDR